MSLWLRRKDREGRTQLYLVGIPWFFVAIAIVGVALVLLMPLLQWLRELLF
jgi:hypothetical protein